MFTFETECSGVRREVKFVVSTDARSSAYVARESYGGAVGSASFSCSRPWMKSLTSALSFIGDVRRKGNSISGMMSRRSLLASITSGLRSVPMSKACVSSSPPPSSL
ncbi:hypothetical protein EYF80_054849 [Liparis tanakae]|uniref:Uncharacterized protein n=1 Tax=Liparis tanakae TaxID=230148 RepID=A0A4Z2F201_9TELE|nr:hypothetical protein EYF80_054849 [Liparis tanakae]